VDAVTICGLITAVVSEQLDVLKLVTRRLEDAGLSYLITGSIATGLYGQPRMTRDIDIVAVLYPQHAPRLAELLGAEFEYDAETIADAIARRRIFSVVHRGALQKVDIIVRDDREYEIEKFQRRRRVEVDGQPMWAISPEDLVLSKLVWAKDSRSELQFRDVRSIIALQPGLDWPYMERWAMRLTVATLLAELRA
jgi:predicted nucleotidyltransferase